MPDGQAMAVTCPECGRETHFSVETGKLYVHPRVDRTKNCRAGGMQVAEPTVPPETRRRRRKVPKKKPEDITEIPEARPRSTSVRAMSGGLPGLGRR